MELMTEDLPEPLASHARKAWHAILERAGNDLAERLVTAAGSPAVASQLPRILACSPFVADLARRRPDLLAASLDSGELHSSPSETAFREQLQTLLAEEGAAFIAFLQRLEACAA